MHLILTHEQADFDAAASLLAAKLLHPQAHAVLPRRINRNVRGFLTLYGERLPLAEFGDLPRERVERVTLVDTHSLPSVKGVTAGAAVHVIDHHPPPSNLEPTWSIDAEDVGATTTLLVEALRSAGVELDLVQSTLLLLGVYEDTGSLTYAHTSARDALAAAWLLEVGASLAIAADFLSQPLTVEQRELYERLLEGAETHTFHGLSVVVASADAGEWEEEVSTLAHKMRDLFEPAGLFVLVALDDNVQLVARSTSDSIDVGAIADHFGGGGHARAAAALIHDRALQDVRRELLELLERAVAAPRRVGEIMSREPQLLAPQTSIAEAAERMSRFGHEGYPVVEEGRVVGLLTRRAVDRALAHGMGKQPVGTVMEAGEVVVSPSDSVQHLQRTMIQHGWGQIPVTDPESGKIIGIVTRTDVLQTLAERERGGSRPLAEDIERALPPGRLRLLKLIAGRAEALHNALYIVGGFVRDLLLEMPSVDFDLVVEGDAIRLARSLAEDFGGEVVSHHRFGTAKWMLDARAPGLGRALGGEAAQLDLPASLDFVAARTEFYPHPTALPSVERGSIKLDLHRRDFTINTLALRLDGRHYGQVLDFWGGGEDLKAKLIRVLHSLSFVDDPTRMLRAVRLEQRLGFTIESRTMDLLVQAIPLLDRVSGDRVRGELEPVLEKPRMAQILTRLEALGLLRAIHSSLTWDAWLERRFEDAKRFSPPEEWKLDAHPSIEGLAVALWTYRLTFEQAREVCDRLHMAGKATRSILEANRLGPELSSKAATWKPSEVVNLLDGRSELTLTALWLALADQPQARGAVEGYVSRWRFVEPATDGNDLRRLGLAPGPEFGRILSRLRAAWLDGEVSSPEAEAALLRELLQEVGPNGREAERSHT